MSGLLVADVSDSVMKLEKKKKKKTHIQLSFSKGLLSACISAFIAVGSMGIMHANINVTDWYMRAKEASFIGAGHC